MEETRMVETSWLDACFVQKILQKVEKDESIQVSSVIVKEATAKGDNYASDMHRISVVFSRNVNGNETTETTSLIAKVAPYGGRREEMILSSGFFETEMSMMSDTLPRMSQILGKLITSPLAARCPYVQYEKPIHLIIEDLVPQGFRMADRQAGLDLDHSLLAMKNLAIFHASSIALAEKDFNAVKKYKKGMYHKECLPTLCAFFIEGTKSLAIEVAKWPELNPRISQKLLKLSEVIYEKACEASLYREDDFNVLNHGDFWVNNMMFRYDARRKPIAHTFVDFQFCNYSSPAIDILYFLGTSISDEVRTNHRELLLHYYLDSLTNTMLNLKCNTKAPSFDKLKDILLKRAMCEVVPSFITLPLSLMDKNEAKSLEEMMTPNGQYGNPACQGKLYRKVMSKILPLYDSMGWLDL